MMRLLALCGSLRAGSFNRRALQAAKALAPAGVQFELYERLKDVPPYDEDDDVDPPPAAVAHLRDAIAAADAVLIATPEYNASLPGQLKNGLDWASRPFATNVLRNKPAAVIGASISEFGAVWAQAELRKVLGAIGARVVDDEVAFRRADQLFARDTAPDVPVRRDLAELIGALVAEARARTSPSAADAKGAAA
jgi:chromate reductase